MARVVTAPSTASARPRRNNANIAFHKFCRAAHAYLSAFAFITLIFFSLQAIVAPGVVTWYLARVYRPPADQAR